jgi:hypothetical protein
VGSVEVLGVEDGVDLGLGEPVAVVGEAVRNQGSVKVVLSLVQEAFPHLDGDDHSLGASMRAEVDRLAVAGIETLGDAVEGVAGFSGGQRPKPGALDPLRVMPRSR